jgi:flagellar protein FliO/FliZ
MKQLLTSLSFIAFPVLAATSEGQLDIWTTFGALIFVVAIIFLLAFLLKKMRLPALGGQQKGLAVVRQLPIGTKERLLIVKAGEEQFLIGVTGQSIQLISKLEKPIEDDLPMTEHSFSGQLNRLLKKHDKT